MEVKRPERVILPRPYTLEYRTGKHWHDASMFVVDWEHPQIDQLIVRCDGNALKRHRLSVSIQCAEFREGLRVFSVLYVEHGPLMVDADGGDPVGRVVILHCEMED